MLRSLGRRTAIPFDVSGPGGMTGSAVNWWQRRKATTNRSSSSKVWPSCHVGYRIPSSSSALLRTRVAWRGGSGAETSTPPPLHRHATRSISYVTNASNFETEVLHSQQAICLVYYIPNGNCSAYLKTAEQLVDSVNSQTSGLAVTVPASCSGDGSGPARKACSELTGEAGADSSASSPAAVDAKSVVPMQRQKVEWLKLCTINADENRNLASAFSVERAKLPITYFVMNGTIVDKIVGHVAEVRLNSILLKFLEHYQKEMNVDLLARQKTSDKTSGGSNSPLPTAATVDLLQGTSTAFLQDKIMNALVGADMIRLPEEAEKLDGLRRTLQEAKKKAHTELQELQKQLGMNVRRLTETEMRTQYFNSPKFHALGVLSALEALYLARSHATLGDVSRKNVDWARHAVQKDFEAIQGDPTLRRVLALVDVNIARAELRTGAMLAAQDANLLGSVLTAIDAKDESSVQHRDALKKMETFIAGQKQYCLDMLSIIDANIDSRTVDGSEFPSAVVDQLFTLLKDSLKLSWTRLPHACSHSGPSATSADRSEESMKNLLDGKSLDTTTTRVLTAQTRVPQLRTLIISLLQLYPTDPKSQDARSRLSSVLY